MMVKIEILKLKLNPAKNPKQKLNLQDYEVILEKTK